MGGTIGKGNGHFLKVVLCWCDVSARFKKPFLTMESEI
jgi:hypothetical protein